MTQQLKMEMSSGAHLGTKGDLCFVNGKLVSVAEDNILKVFNIQNSKLDKIQEIELQGGETYTLCSNQVDKLILAGNDKVVNTFTINAETGLTAENFKEPFTALKFDSEVKRVKFNGSKWIVGISEDEHASVFNTETKAALHCKPGHAGCMVKSAQIDQSNSYIATTGTDGFLNIYKLSSTQESLELLSKVKICEKKVPAERGFDLEPQWLNEDTILIPGSKSLGFLSKDEDNEKVWEICHEEQVQHDHEITTIFSLSNEVLISYSQEDSTLKVWLMNEEGAKC
jgi:WD40 repeat protein